MEEPSIITDAAEVATIINKTLMQRRAETPDDIAELISESALMLMSSVDVCHHSQQQLEKSRVEASATLHSVRNNLDVFRNQLTYLMSQIDYCADGLCNKRRSALDYNLSMSNVPPMTAGEIAQSLNQLKGDFANWRLEKCNGLCSLIVETNDIVIYDPQYDVNINFGKFEISLMLNQLRLGMKSPFRLTAMAPFKAGRDMFVHPHIKLGILCEGAGEPLLRKALNVGDVYMFFLVIGQTLLTYNPESPYVKLDAWGSQLPRGQFAHPELSYVQANKLYLQRLTRVPAVPSTSEATVNVPTTAERMNTCPICGVPINSAAARSCSHCSTVVCGQCARACEVTDEYICLACLQQGFRNDGHCVDCDNYESDDCLLASRAQCSDCGVALPSTMLSYCESYNRYLCAPCMNVRSHYHRPCCDSNNCSYMAHPVHYAPQSIMNGTTNNMGPVTEVPMPAMDTSGFGPPLNR